MVLSLFTAALLSVLIQGSPLFPFARIDVTPVRDISSQSFQSEMLWVARQQGGEDGVCGYIMQVVG